MSHFYTHTTKEFQDALKIFVVDVFLGVPEAVQIADMIIHMADSGDNEAKMICDMMDDICNNTEFTDTNGRKINIGNCCAACIQGNVCNG